VHARNMADGWPIVHHVFKGNWRDAKTIPQVLSDLEPRFGVKRVVFVGDRGMVTSPTSLSCASTATATSSAAIASAAARGVRLHPDRNRPLDRMASRHHGAREGNAAPKPWSRRLPPRSPACGSLSSTPTN
jgi:hypothetical protein